MDAYVLGALPPYNTLLRGKLVACLIRSSDVYGLRENGHSYADLHRFGEGPNWRLRTTRAALAWLTTR